MIAIAVIIGKVMKFSISFRELHYTPPWQETREESRSNIHFRAGIVVHPREHYLQRVETDNSTDLEPPRADIRRCRRDFPTRGELRIHSRSCTSMEIYQSRYLDDIRK